MTFRIKESREYGLLSDVSDRLEKAITEYRKKAKAIQDDTRLTAQAKQSDLDKLKESFLKNDFGAIRKTVEGVTGDLRKQLTPVHTTTTDTNALLLDELREQRAWARIKPLLDATPPERLVTVIEEFAEGRNPATVATLRAELPVYIRTLDPDSHGTSRDLWPVLSKALDEKSLSLQDRMLRQEAAELKRAEGLVSYSFRAVEQALDESNLTKDVELTSVDGSIRTVKSDVAPATGHAIPSGRAAD